MTKTVAINGFGRIGRLILRAWCENQSNNQKSQIHIECVNGRADPETAAHLIKYDSVHGRFQEDITVKGDIINIGKTKIKCLNVRDTQLYPWEKHNVDIVMECTGKLNSREKATVHIKAGAKKIIFSAPAKNADITVVIGVNQDQILETHDMISNASCTTNCIAPMAKLLHENCGIKHGSMTTIHSYTADQRLVDGTHKDLRRARAANLSLITTTTGATNTLGIVYPKLKDKIIGNSVRVPTTNVSMLEFVFQPEDKTDTQQINSLFKNAALQNPDIFGYNQKPLVSVDFNHTIQSCIFDATQTHCVQNKLMQNELIRVVAWYDNEWAYAHRMLDLVKYLKY